LFTPPARWLRIARSPQVGLPIWRKRFWLAGFFFLVVNATIIDLVAFALTPLSLIAPFAGMTIVFSALLAASGLITGGVKEVIERLDMLVIGIILAGVTTVSLFGPRSPEGDPPNMETMLTYFYNPPFVLFSVISSVVIFSFVTTQCFACGRAWLNEYAVLKTLCNAFTAAGCGALSQMSLKIVATAIRETVNGRPALMSLAFWASLFGLAAFAPLQLVLLNSTLANSPVSFAVPVYQTLLIVLTILAGGTFFLEFGTMDAGHGVFFGLGVALSVFGLCILSLRKKGDVAVQTEKAAQNPRAGILDSTSGRASAHGNPLTNVKRSDSYRDSPIAPRPPGDTPAPHPLSPGPSQLPATGSCQLAAPSSEAARITIRRASLDGLPTTNAAAAGAAAADAGDSA
jgi:hypothetical protein